MVMAEGRFQSASAGSAAVTVRISSVNLAGEPLWLGKDVLRPCFHERTPLFQQICPVVGGFHLVSDGMRKRTLCKVARKTVFTRPIAKAGAEAVGSRESPRGIAVSLGAAK